MTVAERVADGWNGLLGRVRHPRASEVTEANASGLQHLQGHKYCLLVTFRRSGEPVPTPVWFGLDGDRLYARSEERVGKVKRIRSNPRVLVAPCDARGKPLGPAAEAQARIVSAAEEERAERAIQSNFGIGRRVYEGVAMNLGPQGVYLEVTAL
jgi:PPOX class probable F420-dependent enzyme